MPSSSDSAFALFEPFFHYLGMTGRTRRCPIAAFFLLGLIVLLVSCGSKNPGAEQASSDPHLSTNGTIEISAELLEIPEGAIFKRDLYDYATVLKYRLIAVHRGSSPGDTFYVGHYNPWKPRAEAADKRVAQIGGNLRQFQAGQRHRLALESSIDDHFMGGIVNKYFGQATNTILWAVWTNLE